MVHLRIVFLFILSCFLKGKWWNWKAYYPTILFFILGDTTYDLITCEYPYWQYRSELMGNKGADLFWGITVLPCIVILFLSHLPKGFFRHALYILCWATGYALVELVINKLGRFVYFHGWSTFYSFLFDIALFSFLLLHYKKPLAAWAATILVVPAFLWIVGFPFENLLNL